MLLPADLQNSHQNDGRIFLIFVADPITIRLCRSQSPQQEPLRLEGAAQAKAGGRR
jgi:hypothetical protein